MFEQDAGEEINELGKLGETEYFEKAYALPRAYQWETENQLNDQRDVIAAGAQIMAATDIDDKSKSGELDALVDQATRAGIDISIDEVTTTLTEEDFEVPSYSWVHLNDFRLFELHGRCYPWTTENELREATDSLPRKPRPEWEQ